MDFGNPAIEPGFLLAPDPLPLKAIFRYVMLSARLQASFSNMFGPMTFQQMIKFAPWVIIGGCGFALVASYLV